MAGRNLLFTMTTGETGKVLWFKLEPTDAQGRTAAVDISGWTVTLSVTKDSGTAIANLTDAACVPDPDQVNNIGEGTFTFSAPQAAIAPGTYRVRIKGVDGSGNPNYFPGTQNTDHATLKVWAQ